MDRIPCSQLQDKKEEENKNKTEAGQHYLHQ